MILWNICLLLFWRKKKWYSFIFNYQCSSTYEIIFAERNQLDPIGKVFAFLFDGEMFFFAFKNQFLSGFFNHQIFVIYTDIIMKWEIKWTTHQECFGISLRGTPPWRIFSKITKGLKGSLKDRFWNDTRKTLVIFFKEYVQIWKYIYRVKKIEFSLIILKWHKLICISENSHPSSVISIF